MNQTYLLFIAATGFMAFLYFLTCNKFLSLLASKYPEAFDKLGKPHYLTEVKTLLKYIKSKDYHQLDDAEVDSLGQLISFLYYAGLTLLGLTSLVLFALAIK